MCEELVSSDIIMTSYDFFIDCWRGVIENNLLYLFYCDEPSYTENSQSAVFFKHDLVLFVMRNRFRFWILDEVKFILWCLHCALYYTFIKKTCDLRN